MGGEGRVMRGEGRVMGGEGRVMGGRVERSITSGPALMCELVAKALEIKTTCDVYTQLISTHVCGQTMCHVHIPSHLQKEGVPSTLVAGVAADIKVAATEDKQTVKEKKLPVSVCLCTCGVVCPAVV